MIRSKNVNILINTAINIFNELFMNRILIYKFDFNFSIHEINRFTNQISRFKFNSQINNLFTL